MILIAHELKQVMRMSFIEQVMLALVPMVRAK
jgi:hypothetical protein